MNNNFDPMVAAICNPMVPLDDFLVVDEDQAHDDFLDANPEDYDSFYGVHFAVPKQFAMRRVCESFVQLVCASIIDPIAAEIAAQRMESAANTAINALFKDRKGEVSAKVEMGMCETGRQAACREWFVISCEHPSDSSDLNRFVEIFGPLLQNIQAKPESIALRGRMENVMQYIIGAYWEDWGGWSACDSLIDLGRHAACAVWFEYWDERLPASTVAASQLCADVKAQVLIRLESDFVSPALRDMTSPQNQTAARSRILKAVSDAIDHKQSGNAIRKQEEIFEIARIAAYREWFAVFDLSSYKIDEDPCRFDDLFGVLLRQIESKEEAAVLRQHMYDAGSHAFESCRDSLLEAHVEAARLAASEVWFSHCDDS